MADQILIGMNRPAAPPDFGGVIACGCGDALHTRGAIFSHWQMGHFDSPVYATREEALEQAAAKLGTPNVEALSVSITELCMETYRNGGRDALRALFPAIGVLKQHSVQITYEAIISFIAECIATSGAATEEK